MPGTLSAALQRVWLRRGPAAIAMLPAALLYGALRTVHARLNEGAGRSSPLPRVPVIVVGNVVAGGAGKTPVVIAVVEHLRTLGLRVGVVSRGYGRRTRGCLAVTASARADDVGDEPLLIARRCEVPVFVAQDRPQAVHALLHAHPGTQVLVSDDGLQHLALARDIEICVFDERGIGNGWLLPAGPLREPWPRRADLVLRPPGVPIAGHDVARRLSDMAMQADGSRRPLSSFAGSPVAAVAGIARPRAFFDMLRSRGLMLAHTVPMPDHHDFEGVAARLPGPGLPLLCTEKDAVKLWRIRPDAWAVPLEVTLAQGFWSSFDALLRKLAQAGRMPPLSSNDGSQAA